MTRAPLERAFFLVEALVTALLYPWYRLWQRLSKRPTIPVLMYHQIGSPLGRRAGSDDCVSPERFALHMRVIAQAGYQVVPLRSVVRGLGQGPATELRKCVAITFDDGYRDQVVHALPVLRRHGMSATFFLVAGCVGTDALLPHLSRDGVAAVPAGWLPLTWDDARALVAQGMDVGSHAVSHRSLGRLGLDEARREIEQSRTILEKGLGTRVRLFAYPFGSGTYGDFDSTVAELLRAAGYEGACTTVWGTNAPGVDRFALRRIPMAEGDGAFRVRCKLAGAYDWVGVVKDAWQRLVPREDRVDAGVPALVTTDAP